MIRGDAGGLLYRSLLLSCKTLIDASRGCVRRALYASTELTPESWMDERGQGRGVLVRWSWNGGWTRCHSYSTVGG